MKILTKQYLFLFVITFLFSCKKGPISDAPKVVDKPVTIEDKTPPGEFSVEVKDLNLSGATIIWTPSKTSNTNEIKYSIAINGQVVINDTKDLFYKLQDLKENTLYKGTVTAKDKYGATFLKDFTFKTKDSFIKFFNAYDFTDWSFGNLSHGLISTLDGGFALSGMSNINNEWCMILIKTDAKGVEQWHKKYLFKAYASLARRVKIIQTADRGFILGSGGYVCKVSETGALQWERKFESHFINPQIECLIASKDGGAIMVGSANFPAGSSNKTFALFIKINDQGQTVWQTEYSEKMRNNPKSVLEMPSGEIYCYGTSGGEYTVSSCLYKLNKSGEVIDFKFWKEGGDDFAEDIKLTSNNTLLCGGMTGNNGQVMELDLNGNILKNYADFRMPGSYYSVVNSITPTDDGFAVTGYSLVGGISFSKAVMFYSKVDKSGKIVWQKYGDSKLFESYGVTILQTPDQGYAICGYGNYSLSGQPRSLLFKVNNDGDHD